MSSTRIEYLINEVQAAFDCRPTDIEAGLDVENAALLQLRKAATTRSSSRRRSS